MATTSEISPDGAKMVSEESTEKESNSQNQENVSGELTNEIGESKNLQLKKLV